jgi:hypothetical protein
VHNAEVPGEAGFIADAIVCPRKIEMTPGAQSRDDTRAGGGHGERGTASKPNAGEGPSCILAVRLSSAFDCLAGSGLSYYVAGW